MMIKEMISNINLNDNIKLKIESSIVNIIHKEFNGQKSKVSHKHGRLNFACPYCGDSHDNHSKKRGNIFWDTLMFHCYNGGCPKKHTNLVEFLKDFDEKLTNVDDLTTVLDYISANKVSVKTTDYLEFEIFSTISSLAVEKDDLLPILGAKRIYKNDQIYLYLKSRLLHQKLDNFAWNPKRNQLYVLNLKDDKVIGFQIKNLNSNYKNKYISYTLEKMYTNILKKPQLLQDVEGLEKINTLSIYFGLFDVDFSKTFTIFEGPMDHLLYPGNSIAISGADKNSEMFDDNPNSRYLFDNDKVGIQIMNQKILLGKSVFMWKKLLDKYNIPSKKVKDYNDLIIWCYRKRIQAYKEVENHFSKDKLDAYYI